MVKVNVLGPLRAEVAGRAVDLGSPKQRAVIARLVSAGGHVVSTDRFVDDLWHSEPPPKALAALQVYVSNLRRVLEPDRRPRTPAKVLVSAAPGYRLRLDDDAVDGWRLGRLVDAGAAALAGGDPDGAVRLFDDALALWAGPAYAEFADEPWAAPEAARLDELRLVAVEYRAEALLALGRPAETVPDLDRHLRAHPLRENAVRLLALATYRAGRQGDALALLRQARDRLVAELGVDPGPALRRLEARILAQDPSLDRTATNGERANGERANGQRAYGHRTEPPVRSAGPEPAAAAPYLVGRTRELTRLTTAADAATGRRFHSVWLGGEPGAGKSTLADALGERLRAAGWRVARGRCPEVDGGAPPAWAWSEALRGLVAERPPPAELAERLAPLLNGEAAAPARTGQFWLARAVADYLALLTETGPLLVALDDVHRADGETLQLLRHLAGALATAPVLVLASHRPAEVTTELGATWAALAGPASEHVTLGGLPGDDVRRLLRHHLGDAAGALDEATVRTVVERTDGNPLFVCELARLIAAEGANAAGALPAGVREVIRRRVSRLPDQAQRTLRTAAVVGRDVDVDVLLAMDRAGSDTEEAVLDALEAGVLTGLLTEPAPGRVRFGHALVRDTLYEDTPALRRTRLHGRVLAALEKTRPDDVSALAHHAMAAHDRPTIARYATAAARAASAMYAHREAAALWEGALAALGDESAEDALAIRCGLVSAYAHAGDVRLAREHRARAVELAARTPDPLAVARALAAFDAPLQWTMREDRQVDWPLVELIERTLADVDGDAHPELRCRLLVALVFELEGDDNALADEASAEAMRLARRLDDGPDTAALRCLALNARYFVALTPDWRHDLAEIGTELLAVGSAAGLLGYQALAHHSLFQVSLANNDLDGARRHVDRAVEHSTGGQLGLALAILSFFDALCALVAGDFDRAEQAYDLVAKRLGEAGGMNADAVGALSRFTVRLARGNVADSVQDILPLYDRIPEQTADFYARALIAAGRVEEARRVWRPDQPVRRDYYWLMWTAVRAQVAVALGDTRWAAELYRDLTPWAGQLAGIENGSTTVGPVDHVLGDLAALLAREGAPDLPKSPAEHYAAARAVAERVGAPHWVAEAELALHLSRQAAAG